MLGKIQFDSQGKIMAAGAASMLFLLNDEEEVGDKDPGVVSVNC